MTWWPMSAKHAPATSPKSPDIRPTQQKRADSTSDTYCTNFSWRRGPRSQEPGPHRTDRFPHAQEISIHSSYVAAVANANRGWFEALIRAYCTVSVSGFAVCVRPDAVPVTVMV